MITPPVPPCSHAPCLFRFDEQRQELRRCGLTHRQIPRDTIEVLRRLQGLGSVAALKEASLEAMLESVALGRSRTDGTRGDAPSWPSMANLTRPPVRMPEMDTLPPSLDEVRSSEVRSSEARSSAKCDDAHEEEHGSGEDGDASAEGATLGLPRRSSFSLPLTPPSPLRSPSAERLREVAVALASEESGGMDKRCWEQSAEWETALAELGLYGLSYQPGFPKRFSVQVLSYNLNVLPHGARLLGGPSHDYPQERLQAFVDRPELVDCEVLLLQEIFATPVLRTLLCRQRWLRQQLALRGFVHQVVSPLHAGVSFTFRKGAGGSWTDSGLLIASKLPVVSSGFERYQRGLHLDAGATKGILYSKLQVGSRQLWVFNTHLQASHSGAGGSDYCKLRALQLSQLRQCISEVTLN